MDYSKIGDYMVTRKHVGALVGATILGTIGSLVTTWHLMSVYDLTIHQWVITNLFGLPFSSLAIFGIIKLTNYLIVGE